MSITNQCHKLWWVLVFSLVYKVYFEHIRKYINYIWNSKERKQTKTKTFEKVWKEALGYYFYSMHKMCNSTLSTNLYKNMLKCYVNIVISMYKKNNWLIAANFCAATEVWKIDWTVTNLQCLNIIMRLRLIWLSLWLSHWLSWLSL